MSTVATALPMSGLTRHKRRRSKGHRLAAFDLAPDPVPSAPTGETEDPGKSGGGMLSGLKDKVSNASGKNRMVVVGGVVVLFALGLVLYWKFGRKDDVNQEQLIEDKFGRRVRWGDKDQNGEEDEEEEGEEDPAEVAREQQMGAAREIQQMVNALSALKQQLDRNAQEAAANMEKIQGMVGENKASYDDALSSFEADQSLSTAFMMKDDLDKRRNGMAQLQQELELTKTDLAKQYNMQLHMVKQLGAAYKGRYGTDPPIEFNGPPPVMPQQQRQPPPRPPPQQPPPQQLPPQHSIHGQPQPFNQ